MLKNRKAFTTPEILLTMLVLGLVVVMTIIVLSQETSGREVVLKVKKSYSIVANAYEQALVSDGETYEWDSMHANSFMEKIGKRLNIAENCSNTTNASRSEVCFPGCAKIYKASGGSLDVCTSSETSKMLSAEGFSFAIQIEDPVCSIDITGLAPTAPPALREVCGTLLVDIDNSSKKRNRNLYGRDLFLFYVTREGMFPTGLDIDKVYPYKNGECKQKVLKDEFGCSALMVYGDNKLEK